MLKHRESIAVILARGGSKSIPLKNIKSFCGKPLIYWSLQALVESNVFKKIYVSTDSEQIKSIVDNFSMENVSVFDRSKNHAQDHSSSEDSLIEVLNEDESSDHTLIWLVQATSPLLEAKDLVGALKQYEESQADSLLTVSISKRFFWEKIQDDAHLVSPLNYDIRKRPRRQDFKGNLIENGSFYISRKKDILESHCRLNGSITAYVQEEYKSYEIDEPDDWGHLELLMHRHQSARITRGTKNQIRYVFSDCDGTLTDCGMYYGPDGEQLKRFSTLDGHAVQLLRESNIKFGLITKENSKIAEARAKKVRADFIFIGIEDKKKTIESFCLDNDISLAQIAFIGDDINDYELLASCGLAACPSNAHPRIKSIPGIIELEKPGGHGALREFVEKYICE